MFLFKINMMKKYLSDLTLPITQVVYILGLILLIMLVAFGLQKTVPDLVSQKFYWLTSTALMLFYAVFNSVACLTSKNMNIYFRDSVYSFAALAVASGYFAYLFSGINIFDAGSYSWLFKVIFIVYLVFMSMIRAMKVIVEFAQKEEWNAPKLKKRDR
jgi:hypothetical protein